MVTVIAEFTAKMTNLEKAICFLLVLPCSINKLKSHMLFTCKNFMFSDFMWKKKLLLQEMLGEGASPFSTALKIVNYYPF